MEEKNNPLSPHLQIYKWQISSLLSITHRIVGVINFLAINLICLWFVTLQFGQDFYEEINFFLNMYPYPPVIIIEIFFLDIKSLNLISDFTS